MSSHEQSGSGDVPRAARGVGDHRSQGRWLLGALLIGVALSASAREVPCDPPGNTRKPCLPPATYRLKNAAVNPQPLDAPTVFLAERNMRGRIEWLYAKAGPASKPCTAAQIAENKTMAYACAAKDGDVLLVITPFREEP